MLSVQWYIGPQRSSTARTTNGGNRHSYRSFFRCLLREIWRGAGSAEKPLNWVTDCDKAAAILKARPASKDFRMEDARVGVNRKKQVNIFDIDGSRVELMEPVTIDGKPTPPSTARPPIK